MPLDISWSDLLSLVRSGDRVAEAHLYHHLHAFAFAWFRAWLPGADYLEDLTQDAVIWMFGNLDMVREPESLVHLFQSKCRNLTKDYLRKRSRQRDRFTPIDFLESFSRNLDSSETPEENPITHLSDEGLDLDLLNLTQNQKTLLQRHYIDGWHFRDIAFEQNVSESCVRQRLHRTVLQIREQLQPYHHESSSDRTPPPKHGSPE